MDRHVEGVVSTEPPLIKSGLAHLWWKLELSRLAQETGLRIRVCHFPPGTSKWNKIEHRLFSFITMNWRGRPLISHEVIVQLIASTKTRSGLTVRSEIDSNSYPKGVVVSDADFAGIKGGLKSEVQHPPA